MNKYEKLIYRNELGQQIEFSLFSPFHIISSQGLYGLGNEIITTRGMNQDGLTISRFNTESRNIVITCAIKSDVINNKRDALIAINPKLKGSLIYSFKNEYIRYIECIVEKSPDFSNDRISKFQISLICPYPFFKEIEEKKVNIAMWRAQFHFPLVIPKDIPIILGYREPSLIVNINNTGDVTSGMIIEFKALGTLVNPSLFNVNTREYIKLNKTMEAGEVIKINTYPGKKKIISTINGISTNILNYLDLTSTFLQLDVGDNLFRYDAEENIDNLEVSIYYNPCYLGV